MSLKESDTERLKIQEEMNKGTPGQCFKKLIKRKYRNKK